jgi:hypothetical protein
MTIDELIEQCYAAPPETKISVVQLVIMLERIKEQQEEEVPAATS